MPELAPMPDILIRDVPGEVIAALGANARRAGLSRSEYLRRVPTPRGCARGRPFRRTVHPRGPAPNGRGVRGSERPGDHASGLGMTLRLVDKSAYARLGEASDHAEWSMRIDRGLVGIGTLTRLELGFSARNGANLRSEAAGRPLVSMPREYPTPAAGRPGLRGPGGAGRLRPSPRPIDPRPVDRGDRRTGRSGGRGVRHAARGPAHRSERRLGTGRNISGTGEAPKPPHLFPRCSMADAYDSSTRNRRSSSWPGRPRPSVVELVR